MISDPMSNPGFLAVDRGEVLWSEKRGSKNVSLEGCDLGLGAGKLEGAFAKLPRYFADADKVMDLEQRLLWCMQNIQGLDTKDVVARRFSGPGRASDMEDLVAFIANKSSGMKIDVPLSHPKELEMAAVGEELFYRRGGVMDFSCATCHGDEGKRIRLQGLPNLSKPGKQPQETMALVADLSGVAGRAAHDAAPAVGLLPAAALAGSGLRLRRHHGAHRVSQQDGAGRRDRRALDQTLRERIMKSNSKLAALTLLAASAGFLAQPVPPMPPTRSSTCLRSRRSIRPSSTPT